VKQNILALLAPLFVLSGCATILHGNTQAFTIASDPSGATLSVYSLLGYDTPEEGSAEKPLLKSETPTSVVLERGRGFYREAAYRIVIEKQGFHSQTLILRGTLDPNIFWNIFPPFIAGGWVVDAATGAMWTLGSADGETLQVKLVAEPAASASVQSTRPLEPPQTTPGSLSPAPTGVQVFGFEIDLEDGHTWTGNYSFLGQGYRQTTPVNEQAVPVVRYVGVSSWQMSVSLSSGAVTIYELVADDNQGKNGKRTGQSVSGNSIDNPLIFLNHMEKNRQ
jgi:hypothetical protein